MYNLKMWICEIQKGYKSFEENKLEAGSHVAHVDLKLSISWRCCWTCPTILPLLEITNTYPTLSLCGTGGGIKTAWVLEQAFYCLNYFPSPVLFSSQHKFYAAQK